MKQILLLFLLLSIFLQANTDSSAANWGGFVGDTTVAIGATAAGGAPITAWVGALYLNSSRSVPSLGC